MSGVSDVRIDQARARGLTAQRIAETQSVSLSDVLTRFADQDAEVNKPELADADEVAAMRDARRKAKRERERVARLAKKEAADLEAAVNADPAGLIARCRMCENRLIHDDFDGLCYACHMLALADADADNTYQAEKGWDA